MNIRGMKVNHIENPIGYAFDKVLLSWKVQGVGKAQKAARVIVALDEAFAQMVYDSNYIEEIDSTGYLVDIELMPRTRYYWKVKVQIEGEEEAEGSAFFETGKMEEAWNAQWIKAPFHASPYIRKEFEIEELEAVTDGTLYMIARGLVEVYLNGHHVSQDCLDPGYSCYDLWEQVHTVKLMPYLKQGTNVLGFILGDGWYRGRLGYDGIYLNNYGHELMIMSELHLRLSEGQEEIVIGTDDTYECKNSPVIASNIYDGEIYDARVEVENWCQPELVKEKWVHAIATGNETKALKDRLRVPLKKHEVFEPIILESPKQEIILDFGQIMAGWVEGTIELEEDTCIELYYGEILQQDCFYRENLRNAKAEYIYHSKNKVAEIKPHFTYYGFRYVKVVGLTDKEKLKSLRAHAIYSHMEEVMKVETANPLVNRLIENVKWGQKGNFFDVPTDCPQRNERLGWTGDTQIFAATASYQMDTCAFYTKCLKDTRLEQIELGGGVPFIVPNLKTVKADSMLRNHSACAWGDIATVLPWTMYLYYGDKSLMETYYPMMKDWVEYIKGEDERIGIPRLWDSGFHFADWLALDNYRDPNSPFGRTDAYYVASAWYAYSANLTAKAAKVLGHDEDAIAYEQLCKEIKVAIYKEYFTESGRCVIDTQTAKVLALQFELVPQEYRQRVAKDLVEQLSENNMKLETGFCGTPFLLPVLTANGYSKEAYTLFLNEEIPGWLYEVNMGATTIWERWDSVMPDYSMNPKGMNSLNHYAYGAVLEWFYSTVCGIVVSEKGPGFTVVDLKPEPDVRMKWIKCGFDSAGGMYKVEWKIEDNMIHYLFEIPFTREANLTLPGEEVLHLSSGVYQFERPYPTIK